MNQLLAAKKYNMLANPELGNMGQWQERHNAAVSAPRGREVAMVTMITGWLEYAADHKERFGSLIGEDGFLGEYWGEMGKSLHSLLNGETGRLDCGTLSTLIHAAMRDNGITEEW